LTLEEQAQIQSNLIRATNRAIIKAEQDNDVEQVRKLGNALNMQQKELTNIHRALMYAGKGKKSRTVTELTRKTQLSPNDASTGNPQP
jgi:hypothetical protein